jgi:hypothetical protein
MKSSMEVTVGTLAGAVAAVATVAQAGTTASEAHVRDADMSVVCDKGRASSPSLDNSSGSLSTPDASASAKLSWTIHGGECVSTCAVWASIVGALSSSSPLGGLMACETRGMTDNRAASSASNCIGSGVDSLRLGTSSSTLGHHWGRARRQQRHRNNGDGAVWTDPDWGNQARHKGVPEPHPMRWLTGFHQRA